MGGKCCKKPQSVEDEDNIKQNPLGFSNLSLNPATVTIFKILFGEFLGATILLSMGCMGNIDTLGEMFRSNNNEAITFGFATMIAVRIFLHVSGGHVNPVITLTSALVQMIPIWQVPIFWLAQFMGSLAGCGIFWVITPTNHLGGSYNLQSDNRTEKLWGACVAYIEPGTNPYQAMIFEWFSTMIMCWAWCSIWDYRNIDRLETSVFRYGITCSSLIMCGISVTKSNMNPARSFAPALLHWDWDFHWVFWAGPIIGGITAAILYRFFLYESPEAYSTYWY